MKIKNFIKTLLIVCILCLPSFLLADVPAGAPSAKNILVIQDSSFNFTQLIHELKNDSNSCTTGTGPSNIVTTINCNSDADWPASLAGYDQVWDLRWNGATYTLNGAMATALQGVLSSGGGVFILGENPGWDKPGITAFVNSVTTAGNFNTSGSTTGGGTETDILNASACTSAENFSTDYLNLATCNGGTVTSEFPGWIKVAELAGGFGVITNPTGAYAIGVAFISSVLKAPYNSGKLFVWYDEQAFRPPHSNCGANASMCTVKNIMDFLVIANTTPTITPTLVPNTETATPTITNTATPTFTVTDTSTATQTMTDTQTMTVTPTTTSTDTSTVTSTITPTASVTLTNTPLPTASITPTATATVADFSLVLIINYPNPTSSSTWIVYDLTLASQVTVNIFTISGEKLAELKQDGNAGRNKIFWDGKNRTGQEAATGVYIYSIEAVSGNNKKMIMSKLSVVK